MIVRQRAYFLIFSEDLDPGTISAQLGVEADESSRKGSKRTEPWPVPRNHQWYLNSGVEETRTLDEHFEALERRLAVHKEKIRELLFEEGTHAVVNVVRYFEPGPEDPEVLGPRTSMDESGRELMILRGQHPLLGFGIEGAWLATVADLDLSINFDEYGDEYE